MKSIFDLQGKGEIVDLVESLRHLFVVVRQHEQAQMPNG